MSLVYLWEKGLEADRPLPGVASRMYWATNTGRVFLDDVSSWITTLLVHQGIYSSSVTYQDKDLVTYQGSVWRAKRTVSAISPVEGADWTLFVSKGDTGSTGATGLTGATGSTGATGANAYTTTTASFTQPAVGATATATVADTSWMGVGQELYVVSGGFYAVSSITDSTHVVLNNSGYTGNASPGATVASSSRVSPGGLIGPQGAQGPAGAGSARPDIERNDVLVVGGPTVIDFSTAFTASESPTGEANIGANFGTSAGTIAQGNDSRFTDTRTPTDDTVTNAKVTAGAAIAESKLSLASDAAAGTASRRTIGTGALQAAAGNDSRLSDARTPSDSSVTDAKVAGGAAIAESKLSLASDAAAGTASRRTLGSGATQAAAGNHTHSLEPLEVEFAKTGAVAAGNGGACRRVIQARTLTALYADVLAAPTGTMTLSLKRAVGAGAFSEIATVTIATSAVQGSNTGLSIAIAAGDRLRLDVTSTTGGDGLTCIAVLS